MNMVYELLRGRTTLGINFDLIGAIFSGWMALVCFSLHVISAKERGNWMTLPSYVRFGFVLTGATFLWRSVNLFSLGMQADQTPPGHLNFQGIVALSGIAYTLTAIAVWQAKRIMADPNAWQRLVWAEKKLHEDPSLVPVVLPKEEVIETLNRKGSKAVPSKAGPDALVKGIPGVEEPGTPTIHEQNEKDKNG